MKKYIPFVITAVVASGVAFYSGMQFTQGKSLSGAGGQGMMRGGQFGQGGMRGGRAGMGGMMGGFVNGSVISSDDKSITIKLRNGGSQIIFFSGSTKFQKAVDGTVKDVEAGKDISVTGTANSDGSVTAQTVQIRPPMPPAAADATSKTAPADTSKVAQ